MDDTTFAPEVTNPVKVGVLACLALYCASAILSIAIAIFALQLWRANLSVPIAYSLSGDVFYYLNLAKTVMETGWSFHNPLLGAPGTFDQLDYPNVQGLNDLAFHILSWFTDNACFAFNIYFLLTFPLTALTATFAARRLGLSVAASILVSQLYTFMPFHIMRGEIHLEFSAYYAVPLVIPATLAIAQGSTLVGWEWVAAITGFALNGFSNAYYAIFAGLFLLVAIVAAYVRRRDLSEMKRAAVFAIALGGVFFISISPNLLQIVRYGDNPAPTDRHPQEGDIFGLRLTQILLPVPGHRVPALSAFRDWYAARAPLVGENETASLGLAGACSVLYLLFRQIFKVRKLSRVAVTLSGEARSLQWENMLDDLAMLFVAGLLFGCVGGVGPTLNYLGFTLLRSYNRISVFLGYFAFLAIGVLFDRSTRRVSGGALTRMIFCSLILANAACPNASFIISLPNVAHLSVRLLLLVGAFPRMDRGVLDRTHLQFFTRSSAIAMLSSAGLKVLEVSATPVPLEEITSSRIINAVGGALQRIVVRLFPTLFAYQWIFIATAPTR